MNGHDEDAFELAYGPQDDDERARHDDEYQAWLTEVEQEQPQ